MARNEEKQLARLNRFYLEKQKQEELKKRPPRPRLDTLNTSRELRKWLPTITRDIEFYVKQMEVTCYTDRKIEEIQERIQRLKQEYRAYMHKLRALEPDLNAASSWADRPYDNRKRQADSDPAQEKEDTDGSSEEPMAKTLSPSSGTPAQIAPISTPVLQHMPAVINRYNFETPAPVIWNVNPDTEDQPLQFAPSSIPSLAIGYHHPAHSNAASAIGSVGHRKDSVAPFEMSAASRQASVCNDTGVSDTVMPKVTSKREGRKLQFASSGSSGVAKHSGIGDKDGDGSGTIETSVGFPPHPSVTSTVSVAASVSGTDCSKRVSHTPSTSVADHGDSAADSARNTDCAASTTDSADSSMRDADSGQWLAGLSSCKAVAYSVGNKAANASLVSEKDVSSSGQVQCEQLRSSNPLNLDYSDSSEEDV